MKNRGFISFKIIAILIVFVILILVAVLLVMNFVKKDEDERLKETVINISKAAETEYNNQLLETNYPTVNIANLQYEGEKIDDGTISFDSDGHANVAIYKDNKCAYKYADTQEVMLEKGITKEECFEKIVDDIAILLQDVNYNDDNYLFSGEVYYLNPYDLDMRCQNGTDNTNENECMTWYEISEDDKYVTLILNSNLGEPIDETATITETMISYLNILTSDWDSRLALPNNTIIDGYNFSNAKARILSAYEVANIIDEPNWDKDSLSFDLEIAPYLGENLDFESWYQGGFFTLTPYDEENNYVVNKYGLDISVADGYTNGVRPVIVVEKQYLDTYHNKLPEKQNLVTYISGRMITVDDNATEENIRYQVSKMRAAGIGRAFLDVGKIELVETENGISLENELESVYLEHQENMGRWIKIAREYGIEIVPWLNYSMDQDLFETDYDGNQTWGDIAIQSLVEYVEKIINNGYSYDGNNYRITEIHYDAEPTRLSYQPYYLKTIHAMRDAMGDDTIFSASTAAGTIYDEEYINDLGQYLDEFDVMAYDSMGPDDGEVVTTDDYIRYVNETIDHYKNGISGTDAKIVMIGPMYEDTYYETENSWPNDDGRKYSHMNFYQGEEVETMRVFIDAIKTSNQEDIKGIGFYNWTAFTYSDSAFNTSNYITEDYNQKTVIEYILKNWVY